MYYSTYYAFYYITNALFYTFEKKKKINLSLLIRTIYLCVYNAYKQKYILYKILI